MNPLSDIQTALIYVAEKAPISAEKIARRLTELEQQLTAVTGELNQLKESLRQK